MNGSYGIFLIIVLVLVSGLIAYLGDILGRRLGRRRITLFGLRPRHTAIVISVLAGMMITLFTLIAAATISEKVRVGLTRVDEMRQQLTDLQIKVEDSTRQAQLAEQRAREAEKTRETALRQYQEAKSQALQVYAKLKDAEDRLKDVEDKKNQVSARLSRSQNNLNKVQLQLSDVTSELEKKRAEAQRAEESALDVGRELLALERRSEELERQRKILIEEVSSLEQEAGKLRNERSMLRAEIIRLNALVGVAAPVLTEEVIFEVGEELRREIIARSQPISEIRGDLESFIADLDSQVRKAGAGQDEEGRYVILLRALSFDLSRQVHIYNESEMLEILARQIHASNGSMVVRAFCVLNVPRGGSVPVDLALVPNQRLFHKGEDLATITLDPKKREAELLIEIVAWLRDKVSPRARAENILPDLPSGKRNTPLFGGDRYAVGHIGPDQLFSVLGEIKRHRDPVKVVARTASETWTSGPLELELIVD